MLTKTATFSAAAYINNNKNNTESNVYKTFDRTKECVGTNKYLRLTQINHNTTAATATTTTTTRERTRRCRGHSFCARCLVPQEEEKAKEEEKNVCVCYASVVKCSCVSVVIEKL